MKGVTNKRGGVVVKDKKLVARITVGTSWLTILVWAIVLQKWWSVACSAGLYIVCELLFYLSARIDATLVYHMHVKLPCYEIGPVMHAPGTVDDVVEMSKWLTVRAPAAARQRYIDKAVLAVDASGFWWGIEHVIIYDIVVMDGCRNMELDPHDLDVMLYGRLTKKRVSDKT